VKKCPIRESLRSLPANASVPPFRLWFTFPHVLIESPAWGAAGARGRVRASSACRRRPELRPACGPSTTGPESNRRRDEAPERADAATLRRLHIRRRESPVFSTRSIPCSHCTLTRSPDFPERRKHYAHAAVQPVPLCLIRVPRFGREPQDPRSRRGDCCETRRVTLRDFAVAPEARRATWAVPSGRFRSNCPESV